MFVTSSTSRSGRLFLAVAVPLVFLAIAAGLLVYFYAPAWTHSSNSEHQVVEHARGGRGEHAEEAGGNRVQLSAVALKNIRYKPHTVALDTYVRKISLPGIIVERPGKSQIRVSAPLTGIVTKSYVHEGEAIPAGNPLFDVRLTHEDLVTAQSEFLETADALDVVDAEIKRLESITEGVIAGKRILEQRYEQKKLDARLQAQRQALLLHGLAEEQIDDILRTRYLIQSLTIRAPVRDEPDEHPYSVQSIDVQLGQQVSSGDTLCVLADHCELYIEGTAFEADVPYLREAIENDSSVQADVLVGTRREEAVKDLKLLYLADRVDRESRAQRFYVRLPNDILLDRREGSQRFMQWRFNPGQRVEISIPVEEWKERLVVPAKAVVMDGAEFYVYRQGGETFERVPVHLEHRDQKYAVIKHDGAVFPGDVIADTGAFQIHLALKSRSAGPIDPHAGHGH